MFCSPFFLLLKKGRNLILQNSLNISSLIIEIIQEYEVNLKSNGNRDNDDANTCKKTRKCPLRHPYCILTFTW